MSKRWNFSAEFKAKVALDAVSGELTLAELALVGGKKSLNRDRPLRRGLGGLAYLYVGSRRPHTPGKENCQARQAKNFGAVHIAARG